MHRFIRTKRAILPHDLRAAVVNKIHLHVAVSLQLQWTIYMYANIKEYILVYLGRTHALVHCNEFAAKQ